ncbi:MAG: recombinase family protein [Firmicutes bacterium]|nr:recombinase family protein [Bacillota bacterium]
MVVHKIDRLARNLEDHVAIKAILKRKDVVLLSVVENIEDSVSGKLFEGIHALMAEFYSSNLAMEVKKGIDQKVKLGGWPTKAPLGYKNVKLKIEGREIAAVAPDERKAPLIQLAFELYATGEYSLPELLDILTDKGLRGCDTKSYSGKTISKSHLASLLQNKFYIGIVTWKGLEVEGRHEPLIDKELFEIVQEVLKARDQAGERKRKHPTI